MKFFAVISLLLLYSSLVAGQVTPITAYAINPDGRASLSVAASADNYYALQVRQEADGNDWLTVSLTLGEEGPLILNETLKAHPREHYRVIAYPNNNPNDTDGDGKDDLMELNASPRLNPLNAAEEIDPADGLILLKEFSDFQHLSLSRDRVAWSEFLNGRNYVKFIIVDFLTDRPKLYFLNSEKHELHADLAEEIGVDHLGEQVKKVR